MAESGETPKVDRGWHLELSNRWWVLWGYGPGRSVTHIYPANSVVDLSPELPGEKFNFPFELPKKTRDLPSPREYDRVHAWGWQFRTNTMSSDTGWKLAASREEALAEAQDWIDNTGAIRHSSRPLFHDAMKDIRETVITDEPPPPPQNWNPRKKPAMGNGSMRHVKLEDLLPRDVIKKLEPIMNDLSQGKLDDSAGKKRILAILEPQRADLEAKGVLADYLAWMLVALAAQSGGRLGSVRVE